jgi:hypothetical protein
VFDPELKQLYVLGRDAVAGAGGGGAGCAGASVHAVEFLADRDELNIVTADHAKNLQVQIFMSRFFGKIFFEDFFRRFLLQIFLCRTAFSKISFLVSGKISGQVFAYSALNRALTVRADFHVGARVNALTHLRTRAAPRHPGEIQSGGGGGGIGGGDDADGSYHDEDAISAVSGSSAGNSSSSRAQVCVTCRDNRTVNCEYVKSSIFHTEEICFEFMFKNMWKTWSHRPIVLSRLITSSSHSPSRARRARCSRVWPRPPSRVTCSCAPTSTAACTVSCRWTTPCFTA